MREHAILLLGVVLVGCVTGVGELEVAESLPADRLIVFSPMFSAFDGVHEYAVTPSVPSAAPSEDADPVLASSIKWVLDDAYVKRDDFPDLPAAIKLTTKKAGTTTVGVTAKTRSGQALRATARLIISRATSAEWEAGEARYNSDEFDIAPKMFASCGLVLPIELPRASACSNCHDAMSSVGTEHTPTQTAFYSNDELIAISTKGAKPAGGTFVSPFLRAAPMPDCIYKAFHTWQMSEEEEKGIVWKLRSIPPKVMPAIDFGELAEQARSEARDR